MAVWNFICTTLVAIVLLVVNKLWEPIAGYVGYPFDARQRLEDLEEAVKWLLVIRKDLLRVDPELSSARAKEWEKLVDDLCFKKKEIRDRYDGCGPRNYPKKCKIAWEAGRQLEKANAEIKKGDDLLKEAQARPRSVRDALRQNPPQNQLSGMGSYEEKVRNFIRDRSESTPGSLGIWGMGGVGKTCLLEYVRDSHSHTPSFDHVLFVQAGKEATVGTMQQAIVASMGLPVMPNETFQGHVIYNHLNDKSFLLLIDDLWGYNDLRRVGIPPLGQVECLRHGGGSFQKRQRKLVFTTRSYDVCGHMGCANNAIRLECLSEADAWKLFEDNVGKETMDNSLLRMLARELVDECSGLPLALCTIGRAMSTKRNPSEWRYAIELLKDSKLPEMKMGDVIDRVKSSYDHMEDDLKNCFLISLLWPRGENIPKEKLVEWWTGLGFLDVKNAINRGCTIISDLLHASMLEKGDTNLHSSENSHVKMHVVTRQMALWIVKDSVLPLSFCRSALTEEKWKTVQKAWISEVDSSGWTSSVSCPQLTMLVTRHAFSFETSPCFGSITFLDLMGTRMHEFPIEVCLLQTLQYLNLSETTIGELPLKLKDLSNLKYLYIRDNEALQAIPEDLILELAKLRVLDLFCSGTNSSEGQYFSSLIEGFSGKTTNTDLALGITVRTKTDIMNLIGLQKKAVRTQALCMRHYGDGRLKLGIINLEFISLVQKLRELSITDTPDLEQLVAKGQSSCYEYGLFPDLEFVALCNLHKLKKVTWENAGLMIRVITISNCTKLRDVTWVQCLQTLEELTIECCPELEKVIDSAESPQVANQDQVKSFGQLKKLYLRELPKLSILSEHSHPFEELSYVYVAQCENLKIITVHGQRDNKIKIDCNKDWWTRTSLGGIVMNLHFVPTFCL